MTKSSDHLHLSVIAGSALHRISDGSNVFKGSMCCEQGHLS